jgi:uncharacterized OB-fold protein
MSDAATMDRMLGSGWLLPVLDEHNRAYFTAGKLMVQACRACGHAQHPPEDLCRSCQSHDVGPRASAGLGRVESVVVVHRAVHPALKDRVPYAVALVSVDDAPGTSLLGNVRGAKPHDVAIGARVRVVFEDATDPDSGERLLIPQWELVSP